MMQENILMSCSKHGYKEEDLYGAYKIFFGTLVSESRLKILNELKNKKMNVTELTTKLNLEQTSTSHDLKRLKKCGFVTQEIKGKYRYYSLNKETIEPLLELINKHMEKYCIHILKE
jgi:DNA-binding transcriptional ArsR family regulator